MKYISLPKSVEAIKYEGDNFEDVFEFTGGKVHKDSRKGDMIYLINDEVEMVWVGMWVVKYNEDEFVAWTNEDFKNNFKEDVHE